MERSPRKRAQGRCSHYQQLGRVERGPSDSPYSAYRQYRYLCYPPPSGRPMRSPIPLLSDSESSAECPAPPGSRMSRSSRHSPIAIPSDREGTSDVLGCKLFLVLSLLILPYYLFPSTFFH
ncbi:uncharacterized protein B0H64DRAFT_370905 [Chaetomium fimeti]|uniref:Uncharacterized protein n=1 Tax=Chaetomium fimeti TaxID=1854472 RepID=A0AAE0LUW5_9PEZI|nr:hypothetical protein B0H64DRAFT_370905 [Chaetomium fimeti]